MLTYKDSGVDTEKAKEIVDIISPFAKSTFTKGVLSGIGSFSGLFSADFSKYEEPVLVSGTDGVGTKLKIAFMADKHDTVGIDLVAMSVNDIITCGAKPLFFLDYIAINKITDRQVSEIVKGISEGCKTAGCALIGGETAEMSDFYAENEYDLAGFAVGVVDKPKIIDGGDVQAGDKIIGIKSSGIHSNGYSLVRKVFFDVCKYKITDKISETGKTVAEELLIPTRIYVKEIETISEKVKINAIAHITGGGIIDNIERVLPQGFTAKYKKFDIPKIFQLIQDKGQIEEAEMFKTFNMGVGMAVIVNKSDYETVMNLLGSDGIDLGEVISQ